MNDRLLELAPVSARAVGQWREALAALDPGADHTALAAFYEAQTGHSIRR